MLGIFDNNLLPLAKTSSRVQNVLFVRSKNRNQLLGFSAENCNFMPKGLRFGMVVVVMLGAVLQRAQAHAATVAVGSCRPTLKSFATIQAAVTAAGSSGTVLVCPGTYPEQVTISTPLTLKGMTNGTSDAVVIVPPTSGLAPIGNMTIYAEPVAAQILVQGAGPVAISDIAVDGDGAFCPVLSPGQAAVWIGIAYAEASSGTISGVVVRNVTNSGCQDGAAIIGDQASGSLTIQNSSIHDCWNAVFDNNATTFTARSNTIARVHSGIGAGSLSGPLTISNNTLTDVGGPDGQGVGIAAGPAQTSTIENNTVTGTRTTLGVGIGLGQSSNANIRSNKISGAHEGMSLGGDAGIMVKYNTVTDVLAAFTINDNGSAGGNIVTNNTINDAGCGIDRTPASMNDTVAPNTMLNVITTVTSSRCP